jgi:hypothetical protein
MLYDDGRVLVADLAQRFRTSVITIRKDLQFLHRQGQLERAHGGALPVKTGALMDSSLQEKERLHRQETMRIAAKATQMIGRDQVIILDSGTTTTAIARACREKSYLRHERHKYRSGTCRFAGRGDLDGRCPAQEFLLAGWSTGGRISSEIKRRPVFFSGGWV